MDGRPRPDHGPGWRDRACSDCGASWVGNAADGEWCPWCEKAAERQLVDQRRMLLRPEWLRSSAGDPRYDELDEVSKGLWDATRGQARGTDALQSWVERLRRAVETGLIITTEAERAIDRVPTGDGMEERTARELWEAATQLPPGLGLVDWDESHDMTGDVVEGFALPGRWTATVAGAKVGKSILLISMSVEVSEGRDPWTGEEREPVDVIYIDSEMGRVDIAERLDDCGYDPRKLERWHACDLPPRLDTAAGGARVMVTVAEKAARLVVIDGLNGVVSGAEKDDTPWRNLYEHTIRPLKAAEVAVVSADNHGKNEDLGPWGSSVKLDKADAIIRITRLEGGVALTATHRRTAAYPNRTVLDMTGLDGADPVRYRRRGGTVWPDGTKAMVALLDELGVPFDLSRRKIRQLLTDTMKVAADPERYRVRTDVLTAAVRWRKQYGCTTISAGSTFAKPLVDGRDHFEAENEGTVSGDHETVTDLPGGTTRRDHGDHSPSLEGPGGVGSVTDHPRPWTTIRDPDDPPDPGVFG